MRLFRAIVVWAAAVSVSLPIAGAEATDGGRWAVCGAWRQVPLHAHTYADPIDVAVVSPTDAWMLSSIGDYGRTSYITRWSGIRWSEVAFPKPNMGHPAPGDAFIQLSALTVVSPSDVWAVGSYAYYAEPYGRRRMLPLTLRWNGSRWTRVPVAIPGLQGELADVAAIPGTDHLWAVGVRYPRPGETRPLILRWTGSRWTRVAVPPTSNTAQTDLSGISTAGSGAIAVGTRWGKTVTGFVFRWTRHGWKEDPIPHPTGASSLAAVAMSSGRTAWAVGVTYAGQPRLPNKRGMIIGWNGRRWFVAKVLDRPTLFSDVVSAAYGDIWAVGYSGMMSADDERPVIWHRRSSGWLRGRAPDIVGRFVAIDGTPHNLWALHVRHTVGEDLGDTDTYHRC